MSIADNYKRVSDEVKEYTLLSGRPEGAVKLVAVTKFVDTDRIKQAVDAGARIVGENRAQELRDKMSFFEENKLFVNLIGQLQTNKVKYVIGNAGLIQSVDRLALAEEISRLAGEKNITQDVLIEVNIGNEPQKGGVSEPELADFLGIVSAMPNISVKGLMCIPPVAGETDVKKCFSRMRHYFDTLCVNGMPLTTLSMGMSGDYKNAILEGATMVRVGTAIFGSRY